MLDVVKLATLRAVVEHGSFSAAAHALGLTQPAERLAEARTARAHLGYREVPPLDPEPYALRPLGKPLRKGG